MACLPNKVLVILKAKFSHKSEEAAFLVFSICICRYNNCADSSICKISSQQGGGLVRQQQTLGKQKT